MVAAVWRSRAVAEEEEVDVVEGVEVREDGAVAGAGKARGAAPVGVVFPSRNLSPGTKLW